MALGPPLPAAPKSSRWHEMEDTDDELELGPPLPSKVHVKCGAGNQQARISHFPSSLPHVVFVLVTPC